MGNTPPTIIGISAAVAQEMTKSPLEQIWDIIYDIFTLPSTIKDMAEAGWSIKKSSLLCFFVFASFAGIGTLAYGLSGGFKDEDHSAGHIAGVMLGICSFAATSTMTIFKYIKDHLLKKAETTDLPASPPLQIVTPPSSPTATDKKTSEVSLPPQTSQVDRLTEKSPLNPRSITPNEINNKTYNTNANVMDRN